MLFNYKALDNTGTVREGGIDAVNVDVAINSLQRRSLIVQSIHAADEKKGFGQITFFERVSNKDVVILSRQLAILFEAQVSALRVFRLIASEAPNPLLKRSLLQIADEIQGGSLISTAMDKHPKVFSTFYSNMVKAGEESGKLNDTFAYLADYLERNFEVTSKARNALIYPAFVIAMFFAVMMLMFTVVIPKIGSIIQSTGQELPVYTKVILGLSGFILHYGIFGLIALIIAGVGFGKYIATPAGKENFDEFKLSIPYVGTLFHKLYLSRITDNMNTMLTSGIPMIKSLEVTSAIVGNVVYSHILDSAIEAVKGGRALSDAFGEYEQIPGIMVQMTKVGEETGELGNILKTMSRFYQREVINAVDTLVDLIEPVMIVVLGVGVGVLLASVIVPIYNLAGAF